MPRLIPALVLALTLLASLALATVSCRQDDEDHAVPARDGPPLPLRINAGGPAIGEPGGESSWISDETFTEEGSLYRFEFKADTGSAPRPGPAEVYETVRRDDHRYRIEGLPGGRYTLRFHFVDGNSSKRRRMDYRVNGENVINNLNIAEKAGGSGRVLIIDTAAVIEAGEPLIIDARKDKGDDVFQAGIEIIPSAQASVIAAGDEQGPALRKYLGAAARFTWLQGARYELYTSARSQVRIMGLDTEDEAGERAIVSEPGAYSKPLFTEDGTRLVFSDRKSERVQVVNWDGSGRRDLGPGFASDVWRDPASGIDWVYLRTGRGTTRDPIVRRHLDQPATEEAVWSRTGNGHEGVPWFQLSGDGTRFADAFPWNACGYGDLARADWKRAGSGCWPGMAPDNSYRFFYFHGSHTELTVFDAGGVNPRKVYLANVPGQETEKVYHPRWSNHPSFLTVTSPETSPQSALYLGRFDAGATHVASWVQVTFNERADLFGDAWIATGAEAAVATNAAAAVSEVAVVPEPSSGDSAPATEKAEARPPWPGAGEGLAWLWDHADARNEAPPLPGEGIPYPCTLRLHERARFGPHNELLVDGGFAAAPEEAGARIARACRHANEFSLEALLVPAEGKQGGPARILTFSKGPSERNFTLGQQGDQLIMRLRTVATSNNGTPPELEFGRLEPGRPVHVLVTYRPGFTAAYLDGEQVLATGELRGELSNWDDAMPLLIGDEADGGRPWDGAIEAIAVYRRALSEEDAKKQHVLALARFEDRQEIPTLIVEGKLVESTDAPDPDGIAPYRRALVENVYEIEQVVAGEAPDARRLSILQWVIMDGRTLPLSRQEGERVRLRLQPAEAHPQLDGEYRSSSHSALDAPRYFDLDSHQR